MGDAIDSTLHLPRILCLHGGGTNARIFRAQCRNLSNLLQPHFRLCFAEAPFPSHAGPDVLSVYKDWGPFRCWFEWRPDEPERNVEATFLAIQASVDSAMRDDDQKGGTGEWVAVLGFSQGAKLAGSLLLLQQLQAEGLRGRISRPATNYRFAVLLAGRAPLVNFAAGSAVEPSCRHLYLPTIHVHGLTDPGLELHRQLLEQSCQKGSTRLVQWDGNHRLPIKTGDTMAVVQAVLEMAAETGVLKRSS
ncbi:hypothetical protein M1830_009015 [Neofusicoccum parvum]|uniref:Uncharacterized protein n=1 Tax=Neofusicoccum parvum TaxID=310453 RepID=A0ACB5SNJ4_9PEZI|nr:hypothetical protein M1830_009015 [Neofusicoccum parvum]GME66417.1 hypothetical protein M1830_009015 [Neofusicoccum parvum]